MTLVRLPSTFTPVKLHTAATVASFPQPTVAGTGGDISGARFPDGFGHEDWNVHIAADGATTIPGPVGLFGEKDDGEMGFIGKLNNGEDIVIESALVGFDEPVAGAGLFKRLIVGGITGTKTPNPAVNLTVTARPIWTKKA